MVRAIRSRYAGPVAFLAVLGAVVMWLSGSLLQRLDLGSAQKRAAADAAAANRKAFVALVDEEIGMRGYLLSGDRRFLRSYERGVARYRAYEAQPISSGDGQTDEILASFNAAGAALQSYFATEVAGARAGRRGAATRTLEAEALAFERLRATEAYAGDALDRLLERRRDAALWDARLIHAIVVAASLGLVLAGAGSARLLGRIRANAGLMRRDDLTGLHNRKSFEEQLDAMLSSRPQDARLAVLSIDLDGFKAVNDRLGQAAGDLVLAECARRLEQALRPSDVVARVGGDEFGAILPRMRSEADARVVADRLARAIEAPLIFEGRSVRVAASIGIALVPDMASAPGEIVRLAEQAMYHVKQVRRGTPTAAG